MSFKLDQSAIDWIDRLASERGENRSETMRAMLAFAYKRMPSAWTQTADAREAAPKAETPRVDEPFQCQLGHRQHMKRAHRAEARELGWLK